MGIHKVLEAIFGSPAKIRILRVLSASPQPLSGRQVGELSKLSHRGAIQALESLVELGAVRQRRVGNAYQYSLSPGNRAVELIIVPSIKAEAALLDELKKKIVAQFGRKAVSLTLYGSVVRGTEKRGSDIDVLAIAGDERLKSDLEEKSAALAPFYRERYNSLLSLHCFTLDELRSKKTLPLLRTVKEEGVTLSGKPLRELLP
ncbi:MAG: nucleotidyltransferase domain-containing protein [Nitrospirae bacterium]|nr:nucleotidyltransferase domain-containing protein [Nitrospirota bacterium]